MLNFYIKGGTMTIEEIEKYVNDPYIIKPEGEKERLLFLLDEIKSIKKCTCPL